MAARAYGYCARIVQFDAGRLRARRRGLVALSSLAGLLPVGWLAPTPSDPGRPDLRGSVA
jgi:hypothetical protein